MEKTDLVIAIASIKDAFAYRFRMMLSIITGPLFIIANYVIWKGIFTTTGATMIRGYTFEQMAVYVALSFMTLYLVWDEVDQDIVEAVRRGSLITYLLRPISFIRYSLAWKLGHRIAAFFLEFIPVILIVGFLLGFDTLIHYHWAWFFAASVIGFIIAFLLRFIVGLLAFYFVRPRGLMEIYRALSGLLYGSFLSLVLYPAIVQKVFLLLPFQFVAFVPAQMFLGSYSLGGIALNPVMILAYGVVYAFILLLIAIILWRIAIRKFCGVGV